MSFRSKQGDGQGQPALDAVEDRVRWGDAGERRCVRLRQSWYRRATRLGLLWVAGAAMSACAAVPALSGTSWREEVLLHDGSKIIAERTVERGGRHEIGQQPPIKAQSLTFALPTTHERVTWKSEYSQDVGLADFMPLLLDIFQGTAYVVSSPVGCLSYNKWGRPNPPYVVFRYDDRAWKRIPLQELRVEIKTPNLIISSPDNKVERLGRNLITAEDVKEINSNLTQPEFQNILREAVPNAGGRCGEMVHDGKGGWIGIGWFRDQPTHEACVKYCEWKKIDATYCPCESLFKGKE